LATAVVVGTALGTKLIMASYSPVTSPALAARLVDRVVESGAVAIEHSVLVVR
jgi:hypothetical protein